MTENTTGINSQPTPERQRGKRRPVLAFGLAALAIGGIGAAITSAAWTDNTLFSAQTEAATFNLQGSLDGTNWSESDDANNIELVVPASEFANLLPGETRSVDLWVRNEGSVTAALTSDVSFSSSSTFTELPSASLSDLTGSLTPVSGSGASDEFQLTVTTPDNWAPTNQGASGTVVVTISGTATA